MIRFAVPLAVVALLAGCSSSGAVAGQPSTHPAVSSSAAPLDITGNVVLAGDYVSTYDGAATTCWAMGNAPFPQSTPFDDVKKGAPVVATDDTGRTVGVGTLGAGVAGINQGDASQASYACSFPFSVAGVPGGSKFYGIKVAGQPVQQFPAVELAAPLTVPVG